VSRSGLQKRPLVVAVAIGYDNKCTRFRNSRPTRFCTRAKIRAYEIELSKARAVQLSAKK
jgi:hypothetical protein